MNTGMLTTHVLDLSNARPAEGVLVELWQADPDQTFVYLVKAYTNEHGRLYEPILEGANMKSGYYEFRFYVGDYFRGQGRVTEQTPFLDCIPVRFGIADPSSHYHVPLLISPGGYSTYRGS